MQTHGPEFQGHPRDAHHTPHGGPRPFGSAKAPLVGRGSDTKCPQAGQRTALIARGWLWALLAAVALLAAQQAIARDMVMVNSDVIPVIVKINRSGGGSVDYVCPAGFTLTATLPDGAAGAQLLNGTDHSPLTGGFSLVGGEDGPSFVIDCYTSDQHPIPGGALDISQADALDIFQKGFWTAIGLGITGMIYGHLRTMGRQNHSPS